MNRISFTGLCKHILILFPLQIFFNTTYYICLLQVIIFLFLVESDSSLLISIPSFIGILIQCWKVYKALGPKIISDKNVIFGYQLVYERLLPSNENDNNDTSLMDKGGSDDINENKEKEEEEGEEEEDNTVHRVERVEDRKNKEKTLLVSKPTKSTTTTSNKQDSSTVSLSKSKLTQEEVDTTTVAVAVSPEVLTRVTLEADRIATYHLGTLYPLPTLYSPHLTLPILLTLSSAYSP